MTRSTILKLFLIVLATLALSTASFAQDPQPIGDTGVCVCPDGSWILCSMSCVAPVLNCPGDCGCPGRDCAFSQQGRYSTLPLSMIPPTDGQLRELRAALIKVRLEMLPVRWRSVPASPPAG